MEWVNCLLGPLSAHLSSGLLEGRPGLIRPGRWGVRAKEPLPTWPGANLSRICLATLYVSFSFTSSRILCFSLWNDTQAKCIPKSQDALTLVGLCSRAGLLVYVSGSAFSLESITSRPISLEK